MKHAQTVAPFIDLFYDIRYMKSRLSDSHSIYFFTLIIVV